MILCAYISMYTNTTSMTLGTYCINLKLNISQLIENPCNDSKHDMWYSLDPLRDTPLRQSSFSSFIHQPNVWFVIHIQYLPLSSKAVSLTRFAATLYIPLTFRFGVQIKSHYCSAKSFWKENYPFGKRATDAHASVKIFLNLSRNQSGCQH